MRIAWVAVLMGSAAVAQTMPQMTEVRRLHAEEAHQGVATDARFFYAIGDHAIGKYRKSDGVRVAQWSGAPPEFIHINSCTVMRAELVCAMSNFPGVPQVSSVERFRVDTLQHVGSQSLGPGRGSLTWVEWHAGAWWACFANYDGRGGEPPRDHRSTVLVKFDAQWRQQAAWLFPDEVLDKFGHMSASGGRWGADGYLYVTGHDRPELYVLTLPEAGGRLKLVTTISTPTNGQAFDWDHAKADGVWSISRNGSEVVESRMPKLELPRVLKH